MQHLEATLQATHTELEAAQSALKQQTLEVERLSYQLQSSAADNARLEQKLSEAEDTLANRSTETEAQHRQEEVFQLKDDLEAAHREKRKMQATERERLDDIEAKRAEIDAMQQKVEQLEERVADLVSQLAEARATPPIEVNIAPQPVVATDSSHVQLLHATIDRLRAERDELRQTMSFVKHEHRFALQASEDDKATTLEKLQMAQRDAKIKDAEVSKKLAELEVLQKQITTTAVELDNLRSRLARQANTEQQSAELASKIEILESDLQEVHRERTDLKAEVEQLGRVRDAAVSDLDAFRYQSTEALKREAKLQQDINRLRSERDEARDTVIAPASATPSMRSPVESIFTRPASAAGSYDLERRRSGHMRRQSMQDLGASQTIDITAQVKALQVSLKSEEDKVNSLEVKLRTEITRKEAEQERVKRRERMSSTVRVLFIRHILFRLTL